MAEIPNALYTNLPVVAHHGAGTTGDEWTYKIPILASDFLYNQRPDPDSGSVRTILRGREEGYPDITHFYDDICKFIGFNPFAVRDFQINNAAKNTLIEQVIHDFMGETNTRNDNWGLFYPDYGNGDTTKSVGPFFFGTGYANAQAAYGTTPYGANPWVADVLYHWIQLRTFFTSNDGILANFEIWPEDTIKTGYIDTSKFTRSNDLIEACALQINIWYRPGATEEDAGTYNFTVQLKGYRYNQNRTTFIDNRLNDAKTGHLYNPKNPLDNKQGNGDEGGNGDWDTDDDAVGIPPLPDIDITGEHGIHLYRLSSADFSALMAFLSSNSPGDAILKWFTNPIQAISACYMLPYPVRVAGSEAIKVLGLTATGTAGYIAKPWTEFDMGTVYLSEGFGNTFLDYSPYTKVSIYLPFAGIKQLNADDTIGHNINVHYQFDNISGACVIYVSCDSRVRYTFTGSCAIGIPITQNNWGQTMISAALSCASMATGAASGLSAAMKAGESAAGVAGKTLIGAAQGGGDLSTAIQKPTVTRSGNFSGAGSALGVHYPFLIVERPDRAKIENPKNVIGNISGRTLSLGAISGYTVIEHIHLNNIAATGPELDEIESLLKGGCVF